MDMRTLASPPQVIEPPEGKEDRRRPGQEGDEAQALQITASLDGPLPIAGSYGKLLV